MPPRRTQHRQREVQCDGLRFRIALAQGRCATRGTAANIENGFGGDLQIFKPLLQASLHFVLKDGM